MKRWTDGRSGESGRYAGNLVLDQIDPAGNQISKHKGTVFVDSHRCWVGRVVADDAYLMKGVLHWANISADQHRELLQFARETQRVLLYLFVTAHPDSRTVRFWQVPAAVLNRELKRRGKDGHGFVLGLHISDRAGRHMLGEEDVTEHFTESAIDAASTVELSLAVRNDREKKERAEASPPIDRTNIDSAESALDATVRRFDIPLSGGRVATLNAPLPMTPQNVARVKGYIDLMSDLFVT